MSWKKEISIDEMHLLTLFHFGYLGRILTRNQFPQAAYKLLHGFIRLLRPLMENEPIEDDVGCRLIVADVQRSLSTDIFVIF